MAFSTVVEVPFVASVYRSSAAARGRLCSCKSPTAFQNLILSSITAPILPTVRTIRYDSVRASLVDGAVLDTQSEVIQEDENIKKKLYLGNLPWTFTVANIKELLGQCGTIADVEIIKQKDGKGRRFAFVTMASGEEAQTVIDKFDSQEVSGRTIRIYFAKRLKKPTPKSDPSKLRAGETRHQLYASNLSWKVRGSHLREFFSAVSPPVSSRVVFDSPSGRSAGYGFVSFQSKEEAEAAISALDGKELMGRPLRLRLNEYRNDDTKSGSEGGDELVSNEQVQ